MCAEGRQRGISVREFCRLRIRRGVDEGNLYVIEEARQKYACSKGCTVVTADKPMQPIDKGLPGPVLDLALPRTRTGRIRTYAGNHPYTVYDYTPGRSREGPDGFLREFHGFLQGDAYSGYVRSMVLLAYIRLLYDVGRQARSRPIPDDIRAYLGAERPKVLPKSPEGQAMAYTLSNWAALVRYCQEGDLGIDNHGAERSLRGVAVGRKIYARCSTGSAATPSLTVGFTRRIP